MIMVITRGAPKLSRFDGSISKAEAGLRLRKGEGVLENKALKTASIAPGGAVQSIKGTLSQP